MSYTRANLESILVKRLSALMLKAGMAVTYAGSNADLNDPIGWALRQSDYTVNNINSVADSDVANVSTENLDKVLDLSEYRLLQNVLGNLDDVDSKLGPRDEKLSQLAKQVESKLNKLESKLKTEYGFGASVMQLGLLQLNIAQHGEETWTDS